jgi:hypothetical protein
MTQTEVLDEGLAPIFTLRAEDLSEEELEKWTGKVENDDAILTRLKGAGAKVLVGPRGSGKSNYLRRAYFELRRQRRCMVAYINFSSHLALEPLMLGNPRALEYFRQWLTYKIIVGVHAAEADENELPKDLVDLAAAGRTFISALQTRVGVEPEETPPEVAPSELLVLLERWSKELGRSRCVLLMDDAAHAFMPQQQREFFELFRALRSRNVACKAAVYPGVTSYSPFFNIGHEAEQIEVWIEPDSANYIESMLAIFEARFDERIREAIRPELVELAAYASFGLPRNFITILEEVLEVGDDEDGEIVIRTPTFASMRDAISKNAEQVRQLFQEVAEKLPRYRNFVDVGNDVEGRVLGVIRSVNTKRARDGAASRAVGVAIGLPIPGELDRVISLLEYSGVVRRTGVSSRGGRGQYEKVQLHSSLLISENALGLGRNPSTESIRRGLQRRGADDFVRRKSVAVFDPEMEERCKLNLTPCFTCQTPRISDDAQFCFKCGAPLTEQSVYMDLLQAPIERLRLTPRKLDRIEQHSALRTVQDVLLDDRNLQLLGVPYIGPVWAARIRTRADEFVSL